MSGQQLLSIVERLSALPAHRSVTACRYEIADADARLRYAIGRLVKWGDCSIPPVARARIAAGRMLGCSNDTVQHRAKVWRRRGSYEAAKQWAIDLLGEPWSVCELPEDCVGHIYVLSCPDYPGLFKIGFSRDPETRRRALSSQYKTPLVLEHSQVGTWLDEHLAHLSLLPFQMANEWFDLSGAWKNKLPLSFFYAPRRMWSELHEAAETASPDGASDPISRRDVHTAHPEHDHVDRSASAQPHSAIGGPAHLSKAGEAGTGQASANYKGTAGQPSGAGTGSAVRAGAPVPEAV